MPRGELVAKWLAAFGAPGIISVCTDSRFIGEIPHGFCTSRNIGLQTVIPGHHQSSGANERRRGHFRVIIDHIIGSNNKSNCLVEKERGEFVDMATMRLNSQAQQFDG